MWTATRHDLRCSRPSSSCTNCCSSMAMLLHGVKCKRQAGGDAMQNAEIRDFGGCGGWSAAGGEILFFARPCLAKNRVRSSQCGLAWAPGKRSTAPSTRCCSGPLPGQLDGGNRKYAGCVLQLWRLPLCFFDASHWGLTTCHVVQPDHSQLESMTPSPQPFGIHWEGPKTLMTLVFLGKMLMGGAKINPVACSQWLSGMPAVSSVDTGEVQSLQ